MDTAIHVEALSPTLWLVALEGEHDLGTVAGLTRSLDGVDRQSRLIVDLTAATFIDSSVVQALLLHAGERAGGMALVAPPGSEPRRVLSLLHLEEPLGVCDDTTQATARLAAGRVA